jgi:hypothetical protein
MIEVEQPAIGTSFVRDLFEQLGGRAETPNQTIPRIERSLIAVMLPCGVRRHQRSDHGAIGLPKAK